MKIVWYGKLKDEIMGEFFSWWQNKDNVQKFKATLTPGLKLDGVYFVILQTDSHDVEFWYEMDNWAVLDKDRLNSLHFDVLPESLSQPYVWRRMKALRSPTDTIVD